MNLPGAQAPVSARYMPGALVSDHRLSGASTILQHLIFWRYTGGASRWPGFWEWIVDAPFPVYYAIISLVGSSHFPGSGPTVACFIQRPRPLTA